MTEVSQNAPQFHNVQLAFPFHDQTDKDPSNFLTARAKAYSVLTDLLKTRQLSPDRFAFFGPSIKDKSPAMVLVNTSTDKLEITKHGCGSYHVFVGVV